MKKILITGANSYIGTNFQKFISHWPAEYLIDTLDMKDDLWKKMKFTPYDVIFHVAGIVHEKENPSMEGLYFKINRDLVEEVSIKAKNEGVKQFIFMSSLSIYGINGSINEKNIITDYTIPKPNTYYGKSKKMAEQLLKNLSSASFKIVILRPPMIYGDDCPGNYTLLLKLSKFIPIFPKVNSLRSMLDIERLVKYIKNLIDGDANGTFYPCDEKDTNISELYREMRCSHNKSVILSIFLGNFLMKFFSDVKLVKKIFGNLQLDDELRRRGINE